MVNYQAPKKLQNINIVGGRGFVKKKFSVFDILGPPIVQLLRALFGPFIVNLGYPYLDLLDIYYTKHCKPL
jgi:hypothetical protein